MPRMAFTAVLACVLGLGAAGSTCAMAQAEPLTSLADLSLEELGAIQITSVSKRAQPLSEAAAAIFVITADDIRRSGATSLPEVLRMAPNLQVAKINNGRYAITARGFNGPEANKLLVLIDGRSVYTPLFAGVYWDSQQVMLQDVARIEVISGPGGTLWGANAVNGVINIITRSAEETQGNLVELGVGHSGAEFAARHGGNLGGSTPYRLYAQRFNQNRTQTESGSDADDAWQMLQVGFRADHNDGPDQFTLHGDAYRSDQGQSPPGAFYIIGVPVDLQHTRLHGANLVGRWTHELGDAGEVSVQAYFDRSERIVPTSFEQHLSITDIQAQYAAPAWDRHMWVVGGGYRMAQDRLVNTPILQFLPGERTQSWTNLFAQDDIGLKPDLHFILGSRWETNVYTGTEWLPNARLTWKPAPEHLLWTALSKTVRAPSRIDREAYVPWPGAYLPWDTTRFGPQRPYLLAGGDQVKSEVAKVFEVGYRGQPHPHINMSVNLFRAVYDKLHTEEILQGDQGLLTFAGNMKGAVTGVETWATYQPVTTWRLSGGFTGLYQRFRLADTSNDVNNLPKARGRDPVRTWQLRSSWDLPRGHELDATVRHVSRLQSPDVPAYTTVDVRWGWHVTRALSVSVAGRNLMSGGHGEFTDVAYRTDIGPSLYTQAVISF